MIFNKNNNIRLYRFPIIGCIQRTFSYRAPVQRNWKIDYLQDLLSQFVLSTSLIHPYPLSIIRQAYYFAKIFEFLEQTNLFNGRRHYNIIIHIFHWERVRISELRAEFLSISILDCGVYIITLERLVRYLPIFLIFLFQVRIILTPLLGVVLFHNYSIAKKFLLYFRHT